MPTNVQRGITTVGFDPNGKEKSSAATGIEHEFGKALGGSGHVEKCR